MSAQKLIILTLLCVGDYAGEVRERNENNGGAQKLINSSPAKVWGIGRGGEASQQMCALGLERQPANRANPYRMSVCLGGGRAGSVGSCGDSLQGGNTHIHTHTSIHVN